MSHDLIPDLFYKRRIVIYLKNGLRFGGRYEHSDDKIVILLATEGQIIRIKIDEIVATHIE